MDQNELKQKLPGYIAAGLLILTTSLLALWGTFVMYSEGWGSASRLSFHWGCRCLRSPGRALEAGCLLLLGGSSLSGGR